ncbi:MAG: hypothetical protein JOZ70_13305 [Pseudolabrys sp.]|nr:hypothetical protein [Pseudolabrys sp.]MBV9956215.1 hypothetical protein [Pseudolabrys sp.]
MTKKILTGALAALALTATLAASANDAQARPRWGFLGLGVAAGVVAGAAIASNAYYAPGYYGYGYRCRYVERVNRWGYVRTVKVCDVPY